MICSGHSDAVQLGGDDFSHLQDSSFSYRLTIPTGDCSVWLRGRKCPMGCSLGTIVANLVPFSRLDARR